MNFSATVDLDTPVSADTPGEVVRAALDTAWARAKAEVMNQMFHAWRGGDAREAGQFVGVLRVEAGGLDTVIPPARSIEQRGQDLVTALDWFWEVVEGSGLKEVIDAQGALGIGSRIHGLVSEGWRVERPGA